jgi:hypothetical protein
LGEPDGEAGQGIDGCRLYCLDEETHGLTGDQSGPVLPAA